MSSQPQKTNQQLMLNQYQSFQQKPQYHQGTMENQKYNKSAKQNQNNNFSVVQSNNMSNIHNQEGDYKYSLSDQKNYANQKGYARYQQPNPNQGHMIPVSMTSNAKITNLNNMSKQMSDGGKHNQFSPTTHISQKATKEHVAKVIAKKQPIKHSKTTSANSPIASTSQFAIAASQNATHNNYVGSNVNGGQKAQQNRAQAQPQAVPQTIQIKSGKMTGPVSKTANHSPIASQQKLAQLMDNQMPNNSQQMIQSNQNQQNQNLNLIHQLQKNQQSMLYRVSQQQVQEAPTDSTGRARIAQTLGSGLQDSSSDINNEQVQGSPIAKTDYNQHIQQPGGPSISSTIQYLPNMNVSNNKQAQGSQNGGRSRMSVKQPSGGVATTGTQGSIRQSQRLESSKGNKQQATQKATYNQKRMQQNSMQISGQNQPQLTSQGSQLINAPPIGYQTQASQKAQMMQQADNRLGSQEFLRKKTASKGSSQQSKRNQQYMSQQPSSAGANGSYNQSFGKGIKQNPSKNSISNMNKETAQVVSSSKGHGSHIQAPHFIKVKSKTNANPTRQNSPRDHQNLRHDPRIDQQRFNGKFSVSHAMPMNHLRDSNNSKVKKKIINTEDTNSRGIATEEEQIAQQPAMRGQVFSMPNSPNKGDKNIVDGQFINSQESQYQQRQSMDKKISNIQQMKQKDSYALSGTSATNTQTSQRLSSGNGNQKNFQNNNRRLNSPNSPQQPNTSAHQANYMKMNHMQFATQGLPNQAPIKSQIDPQQQRVLNMAVSKNIGGIASGKTRRENRNQMMKQHQNQNQVIDNKSVVGSMGSLGSLGPFLGIIGDGPGGSEAHDGYNTMKYPIDKSNEQRLQTNNTSHYSQLQQMHLNNVNPMFFATGEVVQHQKNNLIRPGPGNVAPGALGAMGQQLLTMGGPQNNTAMGAPGSANASVQMHSNSQHSSTAQSNQQQRQKKNVSTSNGHYIQQQTGSDTNNTYYDSNRQNNQAKNQVIQMRKINPISKTTANGSKKTSIERGKTLMQGNVVPNSKNIAAQNGTQPRIINNKQTNYMGPGHPGKPFAQTAKVSYNNSPTNRPKNGVAMNGFANNNMVQQQAVNNQSKRQQQLRQQPIGQPLGDIPLLGSKMNTKNSTNGNFELSTDGQQVLQQNELDYINAQSSNYYTNQTDMQPKKHQLAQSVLIGDQIKNNYQTNNYAGHQKQMSKSIIGQEAEQSIMAGNKLKMKVMSETNSPHGQAQLIGNNSKMSMNDGQRDSHLRRGSAVQKPSSKGLKTQNGSIRSVNRNMTNGSGKDSKPSSKNVTRESDVGQQYFKQYFKQKKHSNYIQINNQYGAQGFSVGKFSQVDSPKDGSIERARHEDMIQQEQQISKMNRHLQNVISIENQTQPDVLQNQKSINSNDGVANSFINLNGIHGKQNDKEYSEKRGNRTVNNNNQQYIIKQLEITDVNQLSPRSKEVYLIRKLITDCFKKYNKPPKTQLELYKIGKMLGKGAFGKVNLGLHRLTRKLVAIKSINMDFMKEESQKKKIMNEINILKSLRHPNNIKILETFQTDKHHMIVMELCPGGDLLNYVRKRRKLSEQYAKFVFRQIMEGIAYLHEMKVSHRDIKLDNILLDGHGNIKIGDFGVSRKIEENEILFEQCGTPAYIAPEIVKDMGYKGFPVDIWSAGICLYAMLYGNVPFKANQIGDLSTVEQLNQDIEYKDTASPEAIDLMKIMLQKTVKLRATAHEVLQHPWLCEDDEKDAQIDIFDEQELELIRKEFTYVVQKKKLKDLKAQKDRLDESETPCYQQSRKPDDLNTEFTECSLQTHENSLLKNDSSRSVILCPFNTQTGDKTADKIIAQSQNLMQDKDLMIRFHPRVRELDRNYEKLNNQDFDNGVYHKYAYKQKVNAAKEGEDAKAGDKSIREENIKQSDVRMNNLVSGGKGNDTARRRRREKADINYHNYYIKINDDIIKDTGKLGFPLQYIQKCLKDNSNNHCTTTYYLLCQDQNF